MDVTSTKLRSFTYHSAPILSAAFDFATESSLFASGSADKRVILWDTDSGTPLQVFQKCFEEQVVSSIVIRRLFLLTFATMFRLLLLIFLTMVDICFLELQMVKL